MVPEPKPQEYVSPMAVAADAALLNLIRISSITSRDADRNTTFGDPPLDHIAEDDDSDEMPPGRLYAHPYASQYLTATSKAITNPIANTRQPFPSLSCRRGVGPIDIDVIDDMSVSLDSRQDFRCSGSINTTSVLETTCIKRGTAPVDLDDTVIDDEEESTVLENCLPSPVDMDSVQDHEEDFSMIWKEHEDEFLVWKGNEQLQRLALQNARARKKPNYGQTCRDDGKKLSRTLKNNKYVTDEKYPNEASSAIVINYDDANEDGKHQDSSSMSSRSLDTFGFSLMEASVDSYGFSVKASTPKPKQLISRAISSNSDDTSSVFSAHRSVASPELSRARTIQRIKEVLHKERETEDTSTVEGLGAKARGLRTLRLRSANYKLVQSIEPIFSTVHEHEEMFAQNSDIAERLQPPQSRMRRDELAAEEQKESSSVFNYPGRFGLVVKVDNGEGGASQSIVSDITNLSDKLFLRVKTEPSSKWDDVSSVGLNGVEGKPERSAVPDKNQGILDAEEMSPTSRDMGKPPVFYDASVKTPPFLFRQEILEETKSHDIDEGRLSWDDVSSIGLLGVEGLRKGEKVRSTPGEVHIPIVINSNGVHDVAYRDLQRHDANKSLSKLSSPPQDSFQDIFRPRQESKSDNKTPEVSLNATFSTVGTGNSDSSSSSDKNHDPEMQKEVSIASDSLTEESKLSTRSSLTPRDWVIIAAIVLVSFVAVIVVVFYAYANI